MYPSESKPGGPKTQAGKRRTRLNALKSGLFAKELVIKDSERDDYETLRTALRDQFAPCTAMQHIALARIVSCLWRLKLALGREMGGLRLNFGLDVKAEPDPSLQGEGQRPEVPGWYGSGRSQLNAAARLLLDLRQDVQR